MVATSVLSTWSPVALTRSFVDASQAIHVDAREHEAPVGMTCAVDLECERVPAHLPAECPREAVEVRAVKLGLQAGAPGSRLGPFLESTLAVRGRSGTIVGRLLPQLLDLHRDGSVGTRDCLLDEEGSTLPAKSPVVAVGLCPVGVRGGLFVARHPLVDVRIRQVDGGAWRSTAR